MVSEDSLKRAVAKNIATHRKALGFTQIELAERLNYTDKSVSKWERGEATPDAFVLKQLSELFGITIDELVADNHVSTSIKEKAKTIYFKHKVVVVPILAVLLNFFVATCIYYLFMLWNVPINKAWYIYVLGLCTASVVLIVFSSIWWKPPLTALCVSMLTWSVALFMWLVTNVFNNYAWLLFVIAVSFQVLVIVWFVFKRVSR